MRPEARPVGTLALPALVPLATPQGAAPVAGAPQVAARVPSSGHGHGGGGTAVGWASSNWSGYAIGGGRYTSIAGSWVVPTVQPSSQATYSASWVGIDGFSNSDLIQAGTEQDFVQGVAQYQAWWEILPAPETLIPSVTVHPGDHMTVSIAEVGPGSWAITLVDSTTGQQFSTTQPYTGPGTSAEWIEEAPSVGGRIAPLADYGTVPFDPGSVDGGNPNLTSSDSGVMIQKRSLVSTPSPPDADTDGFAVAYGATAPPAPSS